MKPVFQTKFHGEGNCLTACVASLLECEIDAVPDLVDCSAPEEELPHWFDTANERLASRGYGLAFMSRSAPPVGFAIQYGDGGRGWAHVVVVENGELVHDPTPGSNGLTGEVYGYMVIYPTCQPAYMGMAL